LACLVLIILGRFLGKFIALIFAFTTASISLFVSLYYFKKIFFDGIIYSLNLGSWICAGILDISYNFIVDPLSITFGTLISFIHY